MDLMMPHMDGWELLQRLKLAPPTHTIPVIICSVINDPELAYSLGANHFIAKPLNKDALLSALHALGF
jgi:CheY-like chemotaxis protein